MLNKNRANIIDAFAALGRVGNGGRRRPGENQGRFRGRLQTISTGGEVAGGERRLPHQRVDVPAHVPFDRRYLRNAVRGDYLNVFVTFDLTPASTRESIFTTSALDPT